MSEKKPLNKYELVALEYTLKYPLLLGLSGIHPDKIFWHMFRAPPGTLSENQLTWTDLETKRLRFLQKLITVLRGSYNDVGIRQWFRRPRVLLDNKKPGELFYHTNWDSDDPKIQKLLELAKSIDAGAT